MVASSRKSQVSPYQCLPPHCLLHSSPYWVRKRPQFQITRCNLRKLQAHWHWNTGMVIWATDVFVGLADSDLLLLLAGGAGNTVVEGVLSGCPLSLPEGLVGVPATDLFLLDPDCIPNTTRRCPWVVVTWSSSSFRTIIWRTKPNFSDIQCSFDPCTVAPSSSGPVWNILSKVGHPLTSPSTLHMPPYLLPDCRHWGDYVTHFYSFPIQNSKFTLERLEPHSRLIFAEISLIIPNPWWHLDQFDFNSIA